MAVREILRMGDPRLLQIAEPVLPEELGSAELKVLVADMLETMEAAGGVGLAAPQIGVNKQLVIFGFESSERYPEAPSVPRTFLCNPILEPLGDDLVDGWEGCLSVPGLRGLVPRSAALRYRGTDLEGNLIDRTVDGFHARVVQHECDHLIGRLYPTRMRDLTQFGFTDVLFPGSTSDD